MNIRKKYLFLWIYICKTRQQTDIAAHIEPVFSNIFYDGNSEGLSIYRIYTYHSNRSRRLELNLAFIFNTNPVPDGPLSHREQQITNKIRINDRICNLQKIQITDVECRLHFAKHLQKQTGLWRDLRGPAYCRLSF